ncbi:unnamed protein product, partial [Adineta steineri]
MTVYGRLRPSMFDLGSHNFNGMTIHTFGTTTTTAYSNSNSSR